MSHQVVTLGGFVAKYLCQNRHGAFYVRLIIPVTFRGWFENKREIRRSLKTDSKKIAVRRARAYRVRFDSVLEYMEGMTKKDGESTFKTGLVTFSSLFGGEVTVDYEGDLEKELKAKELIQKSELASAREMGIDLTTQKTHYSTSKSHLPAWDDFSENYLQQRIKNKYVSPKTASEYKSTYEMFSRFAGEKLALDQFDDELITRFYESLSHLAISSRRKLLTRISSVFLWAVRKKLISVNPCDGVMVEKDTVRDKDRRDLFTVDELLKVFESDYYKLNKWRARVNKVRTPYTFWMFPLALFTGARMGELMLIETKNVITDDPTPYLNLVNEVDPETGELITTLKNDNSVRQIPISDELVRMGFLDFVSGCKKRGHKYLFPDIHDKATDKNAGQKVLSSRLKKLGVWVKDRKSFHSFRHTFINNAMANGVNFVYLGAVTGHLSKRERELVPEMMNTYHKGYPVKLLKEEVIDKLSFNLDFSGVKWPK